MALLTLAEVNGLEAGTKRSDVDQLYWRKNRDGSVTCYQRVKLPAGQYKDHPLETIRRRVLKADLKRLRAAGSHLRANPEKLAPVPQKAVGGLSSASALGTVWEVFHRIVSGPTGSWSEKYADNMQGRVDNHVKPTPLWAMPVGEITPAELYTYLAPVRAKLPDTESKIRSALSKLFDYLVGLGVVAANPVPSVARIHSATSRKTRKKNLPALVAWEDLAAVLEANETSDASFLVRVITEFQAYTCQRASDVVEAEWSEFDIDAGVWRIPRARKKVKDDTRGDQVIHLPPQAVALLKRVPRAKHTGKVFASPNKVGHIRPETIDKHLRVCLGLRGRHVPHGWRSSLKTQAENAIGEDGRPLFAKSWIEAVLDHQVASEVEGAYFRVAPAEGAGRVLVWWANKLDEARDNAKD